MQSVPGGQIDFNPHALLKQPLGGHQIKRVELAARVIVKKEVKITCASGLVASRRAKQIKRRSSPLLQRTRESPKFLDASARFHDPNLTRTYEEQQIQTVNPEISPLIVRSLPSRIFLHRSVFDVIIFQLKNEVRQTSRLTATVAQLTTARLLSAIIAIGDTAPTPGRVGIDKRGD
jgi:hypothetical protein